MQNDVEKAMHKDDMQPTYGTQKDDGNTIADTSNHKRTPESTSQTDLELDKNVTQHGDTESQPNQNPPHIRAYSVFTSKQKLFITVMATWSAFFSPLSGTIYLPALNPLARDLNVSVSLINLTLTTYLIFQGISPTLFGGFADRAGRRPAYIMTFTIYLGANIGLALQNSYAALLVLRAMQSGGSSATVAISMGVVADISTSSERGKYMGLMTAGATLGPALGPILGGVLAQFLGWRSIFWFLTIGTAVFLVPYTIAVPETSRNVVGDGSVPTRDWWNRTLLFILSKKSTITPEQRVKLLEAQGIRRRKIMFPNPFDSVKLLFEKDTALVISYTSIFFACYYVIIASIPSQFSELYGLNDLQIGLCYLPNAIAGSVASVAFGRILDWNYRRIAKRLGFPLDRKRGEELVGYPIEKARLQTIFPPLYTGMAVFLGYGWAMDRRAPLAVLLVLQAILGFCLSGTFNALNTLLVDMYPQSPATITAANNLVRCLLSAGTTAALDPMTVAMGRGWCFTFFALLCIGSSPALWVVIKYGPKWREERRLRMMRREERKNAQRNKQ